MSFIMASTNLQTLPAKTPVVKLLLLFLLVTGCLGNSEPANHLILFDSPPDGISPYKMAPFEIRTNFSGTVHLVESRDFRVVVNITASSLQQAYDVSAQLVSDGYGGMVLEVKDELPTNPLDIDIKWLVFAMLGIAVLVAIFTAIHSIRWYKMECQKIDFSDRKSFATNSSQRAVYRSRNSMQMVHLPPGTDHGLRGGDEGDSTRNIRGEEELRQVPEMPEEEEAEALEMEQLRKLKHKDESDMSAETEDSDPQDRNNIKSRYNNQSKTIHKEMLKKGKKQAAYRRTHNGRYEGVPTNDTDDTDDVTDDENRLREGQRPRDSSEKLTSSGDLRGRVDGVDKSNGSLSTFGKISDKDSNTSAIDSENNKNGIESDPMRLVMADVHKTNQSGHPEVVSINTRDKPARTGNIYVPPSELKPGAILSTFGPGSALRTSTPTTSPQGRAVTESSNTRPEELALRDLSSAHQSADSWPSPVLSAMGDIPEDPREDDLSALSGSIKSSSMYGSSEIFDVQEAGNTYYNVDSDIDIPPLDSDDCIFSDGGLPSPRALFFQGEKGKTNDDIKMIPGALKSPGANVGRLVKPRPNSSIILGNEKGKPVPSSNPPEVKGKGQGLAVANKTGVRKDESLPAPPPCYEDICQNPTVFEFPPPPKFFQVGDQSVHLKPSSGVKVDDPGRAYGDYVQIKHGKSGPTTSGSASRGPKRELPDEPGGNAKRDGVAGRRGNTSGGGGKRIGVGNTYMNVTLLSTLCVLTLASGVLSQLTRRGDTRVDITIFAPAQFFTNATRIFFNGDKDTEATGLDGKRVLVYDAKIPLRHPTPSSWMRRYCYHAGCPQGCDESRGTCVCLKGYRLEGHRKCVDVNECMEGRARCDPYAGCYNRKGSYDCICGEDFYGDGKTCRDCKQKCPVHHYEVRPCSLDKKKICEACTRSCRDDFYLAKACSSHSNGMCRVCQPKCGDDEFESRQCTNIHDRECKNMTRLLPPDLSSNVMMENRDKVQTDTAVLEKLPDYYVGFSRYKLHRSSGFFIEVTVRFIDAAQRFLPVNLTQPFDLKLVAPSVLSSFSVQRYCPTPVPDYYILSYRTHKDLTYKLWDNGSIDACETHQQHGVFLKNEAGDPTGQGRATRKSRPRDSFVCAQPGSLTNIFSMEENFFHARTKWVDKNRRCQRNSHSCEQCTRNCGTQMIAGGSTCSVAVGYSDNDMSPRLVTCYNCCVRKNCSHQCKDYHKRKCQPERCLRGNLLEFNIAPSWDSSQDGHFFCHIQPESNQRIVEMDYTVQHPSLESPIYSGSLALYGNKQWEESGKMEYSDTILTVSVDSGLDHNVPNFMEGDTSTSSTLFKVGKFKWHGPQLGSASVQSDFVFLRPPTSTSLPGMPEAKQECSFQELDKMLLASKMENPYLHDDELEAVVSGTLPFNVIHKGQKPKVTVNILKETSLLKRLFPPASIVEESFLGNIEHNGTHWVLEISAQTSVCPGYIRMRVQDPNYPSGHIFDGDLVVFCPTSFNMTIGLMTSDDIRMYKDILVTFHEDPKLRHFRIYRTASLNDEKLRRKDDLGDSLAPVEESRPYAARQIQDDPGPSKIENIPDFPLQLPTLLGIAGGVALLLVLAVLGLCFQPGVPDTPFACWYHPIFAIAYVTFQFIYAIVMSGTVFFIVLVMITSTHVNFVTRHGREGAVSTAANHVEMLQLQRHLEREISQQDRQVDVYQDACVRDVRLLVEDMKKMHKTLLERTADVFEKYRLDLLLEQQKVYVRQKLSKDLETFRENYAKTAQSILRRINQDAAASFQNILHNNTWLDGARLVGEGVNIFRKGNRQDRLSFMEWTGIKADESRLDIDLSFALPSLPRLDDLVLPLQDEPPVKRDMREEDKRDSIRSIQVHNNWFFPLEESDLSRVAAFKPHRSQSDADSDGPKGYMFFVFLALLLVCDLFLLGHRMCKAWTVAKLILFGFPEYFRERKEDETGEDEVFDSKESKGKFAPVNSCRDSPMLQSVKLFITQTISTTFLPKIVGALAACVVLICVLRISHQLLTIQGLQSVGLYHNSSKTVILHSTLTNARLEAHASYINTVNYPAFQALTAVHLHSHRVVLGFYREQMHSLQNLTSQMYCQHLKAIGLEEDCSLKQWTEHDDVDKEAWKDLNRVTHSCAFQPVEPKLFQRVMMADSSSTSEKQVESVLESLRYIIYRSSQLIIIFLSVIVIKELVCAVVWILIQRSGVIRIRIIVEQDQEETTQ